MFYIRQIISGTRFKYVIASPQPTTQAQIEGNSPRYYERVRVGTRKVLRYIRAVYVPIATVTVSTVTTQSITEGANAVFAITLSGQTQQQQTIAYVLAGSTTSGSDYNASITPSNGVTVLNGNLIVPTGLSSFTVTVASINDTDIEGAETISLTVGGVTAICTVTDNDIAPPSELNTISNVVVLEAPYAYLSAPQKASVSGNGGYPAFIASKPDVNASTFAVYFSETLNGTYSRILTGQQFTPSAQLLGSINYTADVLPYNDEIDMPSSVSPNTSILIVDTAGQIEMALVTSLITNTVDAITSKALNGVKRAAYHYLPIEVSYEDTARAYLLPSSLPIDPTLRANGVTGYYKIVPQDAGGNEPSLSGITAIPFFCTGVANKPYPPKFVGWDNTGIDLSTLTISDFQLYPSKEASWFNPAIYVGNANRLESTPSSLNSPSATMEPSTVLVVEELDRDDAIRNTYTLTDNKARINNVWSNPTQKYRVYANRGGVKSQERIYVLNSVIRDVGGVLSLSSAKVGSNAEITINLTAQSLNVNAPFALNYRMFGSVVSDGAHGTPTLNNGATFEPNGFIQIPQGLSSVKVTIPLVAAAGKNLTFEVGFFQYNDFLTTTLNA